MANINSKATIVIIGAGVIGLSCALKLQELFSHENSAQNPDILLVAKEWPLSIPGSPTSHSVDYASVWAGAHMRPIPPFTPQLKREAAWLKRTAAEFDRLVRQPALIGLTKTKGIEFLEVPGDDYANQTAEDFFSATGLSGYKELSGSDLPDKVAKGFEYDTYCINSPIYCQYLLRSFILRKGKTLQRSLRSEWEAFDLVENVLLVVNASGIGFNDPKVFPTRGQIVLTDFVEADKTVTWQHKDSSWTFIIPRFFAGGTIIGGTKEPGSWDSRVHLSTRQKVLKSGSKLLEIASEKGSSPKTLEDLHVVSDVVGRRPTRDGGVRIELETRALEQSNGASRVGSLLHAYGAGGRGYELSWGIADEVAQRVKGLLHDGKLSKL